MTADEPVRICNRSGCTNVLQPGRKSKRCQECSRAYAHAQRDRDPEGFRAVRAAHTRSQYAKHAEKRRASAKLAREILRLEFLIAYGGVCVCCGESEPAFLTLEHKNRDGAAHRREVGHRSENVLRDLKSRGWPKDDYCILCFNCNRARWNLGECPHETRRRHGLESYGSYSCRR